MSEEKEPAVNLSEIRPDPADSDQKPSDLASQRGTPELEADNQGENIITDIELLRSMDDISETGVEIEASASDLISLFEKMDSEPPRKSAGTQNQPGTQFISKAGSKKGNIRKAAPHPGRKPTTTSATPQTDQPEPGSMNTPAGRYHNSTGANSSTVLQPSTEPTEQKTHHSFLDSKTTQTDPHHPPETIPSVFQNQKTDSNQADPSNSANLSQASASGLETKSKAIGGDISYLSKEDQQFYESIMVDQAPPGARLKEKTQADLPEPPAGFSPDAILNEILLETEEEKKQRLAKEKASRLAGSFAAHKLGRKDRRKKSRNRKKKQSTSQNFANPAVSADPMPSSPSTNFNPLAAENQALQPENSLDSLTASTTPSRRHFVKVKVDDYATKAEDHEMKTVLDLLSDGNNGGSVVNGVSGADEGNGSNPANQGNGASGVHETSPLHENSREGEPAPNQDAAGVALAALSSKTPEPDVLKEPDLPKRADQPENPSPVQTDGTSAPRRFRKQREDDSRASNETDPLEEGEMNLADFGNLVQSENTAANHGDNSSIAYDSDQPAGSLDNTTLRPADSAQANDPRPNKNRRKNRKGKSGKNGEKGKSSRHGRNGKSSESQPGLLSGTSTPNNDSTAFQDASSINQTESASWPDSNSDHKADKMDGGPVINAGSGSDSDSDLSASNTPGEEETAFENQNQSKDFPAKFGNLGRRIFEEESIEEIQKKKEERKALPFNDRLKLFLKNALRRPGTYGLLIAFGAIIYTLIRMSQLSLLKLSMVGLFVGLGAAGLLLAGFWFFLTRHKLWHLPAFLLCAAMVAGSVSVDNRVQAISDSLREMSEPADTYVQNIGLYVPSIIPVSDLNSLNGETFGIMKGRDETGVNTLLVSLADKGIYVKLKFYNNLQQLYKAVRGQAVRAVILDQGDLRLIQTMAGDQTSNQLSLVYSMPVDTGVSVPVSAKNLEQDPFTILVTGSSDSIDEPSYRSNLNVLVTVNPATHQVLTTVLPRSLYIYNDCQEALACQPADVPDRLSFVSYHSTEALRETVEHLIESPVDFVVRLNTDKVLQLFDVGQTIRFNPYGEYTDLNLNDGNVMTGPQIKQFLGVLNDLSDEDLNQELNQLHVLYTLCRSTSLFDSSTFGETMKVLDESVWTSFTYDQLCELAKMFFLFPEQMNESWQLVTGTSSILYSPTLTEATYMTQPDPDVLQNARKAIQDVLNGQTPVASGLPTREALTGIPARPAGDSVPFNFINPSETPSAAPQPDSQSDSSASQSDSASSNPDQQPTDTAATTPAAQNNTVPTVDPATDPLVDDPDLDLYPDPDLDPDALNDPAADPYGADDSDLYE